MIKVEFIIILLCILGLSGCSFPNSVKANEVVLLPSKVHCEETIFRFNDTEYDLTSLNESINAINCYYKIGEHIIIEGHVGPYNNVYLVFNVTTESFEKELFGTNLVWHSNDIHTVLYSFWNEIYDYDGDVVKKISMPDTSHIDKISFSDDFREFEITVENVDGSIYQETYTIGRS